MTRIIETIAKAAVIVVTTSNFAAADTGSAVDARDERGATALHNAAAYGDLAEVRELIAAGTDVDSRGPVGNTPLLLAVQEGHSEVVAALLEAGADAEIKSEFGNTAIGLATGHGHREIAEQLLSVNRFAISAQQIIAIAAGLAALLAVPVVGRSTFAKGAAAPVKLGELS